MAKIVETPLMKQYNQIKEQYPDAVLLKLFPMMLYLQAKYWVLLLPAAQMVQLSMWNLQASPIMPSILICQNSFDMD